MIATLRRTAFLLLMAVGVSTQSAPGTMYAALTALAVLWVAFAVTLVDTVLAPATLVLRFHVRWARSITSLAQGVLKGARTERLGDLVRGPIGQEPTDEELRSVAERLDKVTVAFRIAGKRMGPKRMGAGRARIKHFIARSVSSARASAEQSLTPRGVMRFVALGFPLVFLLLVTLFAIAYLAAWKLNPAAFSGLAHAYPTLWDTWYYSMTTVTTSALSPLRADGLLAQVLVSLELVSGATLVTALIACYGGVSQSDLDESRRAWQKAELELASSLESWQNAIAALERARGYPPEGDV